MTALPKMLSSTQAVVPFDFDKDCDLDLFVVGRNKPGSYPDKATSYMLINNGGNFSILKDKDFYLDLPNMVTSAETEDFNNDGYLDLLVVGEWSAPKVFLNKKGKSLLDQNSQTLKAGGTKSARQILMVMVDKILY